MNTGTRARLDRIGTDDRYVVVPMDHGITLGATQGLKDLESTVDAITRGGATGLVGVMVAVALLPPLVATGLLLGAGHPLAALRAGLLTVTNVVSLNLAAVTTFLVLGVWPRHWRDVEQARASTRLALVLWGGAVLVLAVVLWFFFG